ncbi:MAG: ribonuclease III [Proteobacteria bacterium]|nr:ribonuclease III [Pseudomonadota bacterium]
MAPKGSVGGGLAEFQQRVGYVFADEAQLLRALTHSSFAAESYERLEFLGDRVLGLVVAEWLLQNFSEADEGELTRRLTAAVRQSALVEVGKKWGIGAVMRVGPGEAVKESVLADGVEAVLGAVWLESGLAAVRAVVIPAWQDVLTVADSKDGRSLLQELLQGQKLALADYKVVEASGPDHAKVFTVMVKCALGEASGQGGSKQLASAAAADALLAKLVGKMTKNEKV